MSFPFAPKAYFLANANTIKAFQAKAECLLRSGSNQTQPVLAVAARTGLILSKTGFAGRNMVG